MAGAGSSPPGAKGTGGPPVIVTGAGGFVGAAVWAALLADGRPAVGWVRRPHAFADHAALRVMGDLADAADAALCRALEGAAAVVHLAGRAHLAAPVGTGGVAAFRRDNIESTERLARAAGRAGVPRFIHVSSVKVNGDSTRRGRPFRPGDVPAPRDAYGHSKWAAEQALNAALARSATVAGVLRLPLVYGARAGGNFAALVEAVRSGRMLPLGAIDNRRSLLGLGNLAGVIRALLDAPVPVAGTHFAADADSVSTPTLIRAIAAAAGVEARLLSVPVPLLRLAGKLTGRGGMIDRLTGSLEVDTSSLVAASGWQPRPFAIDPAMVAMPEANEA